VLLGREPQAASRVPDVPAAVTSLFRPRRVAVVSTGYRSLMVLSSRAARAVTDLVLFVMSAAAIVAAFMFSL